MPFTLIVLLLSYRFVVINSYPSSVANGQYGSKVHLALTIALCHCNTQFQIIPFSDSVADTATGLCVLQRSGMTVATDRVTILRFWESEAVGVQPFATYRYTCDTVVPTLLYLVMSTAVLQVPRCFDSMNRLWVQRAGLHCFIKVKRQQRRPLS